MEVYERKDFYINDIYDLQDICWSGALERIQEAIKNNIEDDFYQFIVGSFDYQDGTDIYDLNDFIWFECDDWLEEHISNDDDSE